MKKTVIALAMALLAGSACAVNDIGDACTSDGYVSRTDKGYLLSCVNGNYREVSSGKTVTHYAVHVPQPSFVPQRVYDDGKVTYIEFDRAPAEFPAVFELAKDGSKILKNYVYEEKLNRFRINGLFERGELRIGNEVVYLNRG